MSFVTNLTLFCFQRLLIGQHRRCKLPLGEKLLKKCIKQDDFNFVEIKVVFEEYQHALNLWTNEDSSAGQTKVLVKRQVFQKVWKFFKVIPDKSEHLFSVCIKFKTFIF